jgi:class 3 adenylate cyclase/pimeloyl-ACP methyl ester carboxylesterase
MAVGADVSTRYAESGDFNIAYQVVGEGPRDLVLVPGFVSHVEVAWEHPPYERFMRRLASFARVIVFDKRGSGLSDPLVGEPNFEQRMDDIRAVMDAAGSERAAVLGISEGASMAALFAALHPDRANALILYGVFARGSASDAYPWAPAVEEWDSMLEDLPEAWGEGASLFVLAPGKLQDETFRKWWGRFERMSASPRVVTEALRLDSRMDITELLSTIQAPTLVLHREGDFFNVEGGRFVSERIPDANLVVLKGENHWPWIDDTDAIVDEVEQFLTGVRGAPEPDRVLATVMFTDIVASTERAAELGDRRWRSVLDDHESLVRRELDRFHGREVKTTGDGFLVTFDGPARAIRCAWAIAEEVRSLGIEIRAGLHTGECELRNSDVGGIAVHIGSRVQSRADPSEVLVSSTVKDLVAGSGIEFADRGEHELKGVPDRWHLFAVEGQGQP